MDIRTETSVPTALFAPASAVATDPNAALQDMAARYVGMTLGPLPAAMKADPVVLAAVSAVTAVASSGMGVSGSTGPLSAEMPLAGGRLAESSGLGAGVNSFSTADSFSGRSLEGLPGSIQGHGPSAKPGPEKGLPSDPSFSELSPRGSGVPAAVGTAPRLPDAGGFEAPVRSVAAGDVVGPAPANGLSENTAGELGVLPASPRLAGVAGKPLVTDKPLGGGPAPAALARVGVQGSSPAAISSTTEFLDALAEWVQLDQLARQDDRAKRNSLETQLIAEMLVFARAQGSRARELRRWSWEEVPEADGGLAAKKKIGADAQAKSQLKFFGRRATRLSKRDPREKDKDQKKKGKGALAQQGDSDDPQSP